MKESKIYFEVTTPLGVKIKSTKQYWTYLVNIKHPVMSGKEEIVRIVLSDPDEIRRSKIDETIFLYYKTIDRLYCVVAKHAEEGGFLITAYPADKVKEGETIWTK